MHASVTTCMYGYYVFNVSPAHVLILLKVDLIRFAEIHLNFPSKLLGLLLLAKRRFIVEKMCSNCTVRMQKPDFEIKQDSANLLDS